MMLVNHYEYGLDSRATPTTLSCETPVKSRASIILHQKHLAQGISDYY